MRAPSHNSSSSQLFHRFRSKHKVSVMSQKRVSMMHFDGYRRMRAEFCKIQNNFIIIKNVIYSYPRSKLLINNVWRYVCNLSLLKY